MSPAPIGDVTSTTLRRRRAGRRLVIGFEGHTVSSELREIVREIQPAGFILFQRNVASPAQVRELNRELASLLPADRPPLLTVDQEGGRVQRVREPATRWPSMRRVGATDRAEQVARALGLELRAMGFNLDFAPVADVDSNPANPVIGDRSFGPSPERVGRAVAAFTRGLQAVGVMACAKHFPGHGDTTLDSHLDLPTITRDEATLRRVELPPFRAAVQAGVASIVTAHVVFTAFDPSMPATLSPGLLTRLLRDELGFGGVVFSDDLEMKAVADRYPLVDQARLLIRGTVDLALACRAPELQLALFEETMRALEADAALDAMAVASARRVDALTARLPTDPGPGLDVVGCEPHLELAARVEAEAGRVLG